jgi:cytochrome c6
MSERRVAAACAALLVAAPARAASIDRGQQLYSAYCANCHGQNGTPIWPGTPDFKRSTSLVRSNSQLLAVIRQGKGAMPAYLGIIKEREMLDVIAYLRTMN